VAAGDRVAVLMTNAQGDRRAVRNLVSPAGER